MCSMYFREKINEKFHVHNLTILLKVIDVEVSLNYVYSYAYLK